MWLLPWMPSAGRCIISASPPASLTCCDERLAALERLRPSWPGPPCTSLRWSPNITSVGIFASVAICAGVSVVTHGISIETMPLMPAGIDQRGLLREEAGFRVAHQDRAVQADRQRRHVLPGRIRLRQQRS